MQCLVLAACVGFWAWLAFAVHTLEVPGGESDRYVDCARSMLRGEAGSGPYHPAGLPTLVFALAVLGVDPFVAGKLISILAGAVMVFVAGRLALLWYSPTVAALCAIAVATSEDVLTGSVQACTDVPAGGLAALALWAWCACARRRRGVLALLLGGLCIGLATSMRVSSSWLLAGAIPALWSGSRVRSLALGVATAISTLLGLALHAVGAWRTSQDLFPASNWHNVVLKYHCRYDADLFTAISGNLGSVWREHWTSWIPEALRDVALFLAQGLAAGLGFPGVCAVAASLVVLFGYARTLVRGDSSSRVLAITAIVYAVLLAATFRAAGRLTVPLVIPGVLSMVAVASAVPRRGLAAAVAGFLALWGLWHLPGRVANFEAMHPRAETVVARELMHDLGEPMGCLINPLLMLDAGDPWTGLRKEMRPHSHEYAIINKRTSRAAYDALLAASMPDDFRVVRIGDPLVIAREEGPKNLLLRSYASVEAASVRLSIDFGGGGGGGVRSKFCGFVMCRADVEPRTWNHVLLAPVSDTRFELVLPVGPQGHGRFRLVPWAMLETGSIRRGEPRELTL